MNPHRLRAIADQYSSRRVAIVGDFCLDRYLEIDLTKMETSIETRLPVFNIDRVRNQPGGAGTILNNLVALGIKTIFPVGFAGEDGEGFELKRSLAARPEVCLEHFITTDLRRTFTYTKPLLVEPDKPPVELNRLDFKNWSVTPAAVTERFQKAIAILGKDVDAIILLDQVDLANTGVVTEGVLESIAVLATKRPELLIIADSRRSLKGFPAVDFKMNKAEFLAMTESKSSGSIEMIREAAGTMARQRNRRVFVTLADQGIVGADPSGAAEHVSALPVRGEIDIVGAGDAVTANLVAALSSGAALREALELAMLAASIVVHQLGTTGTASVEQLRELNQSAPGSH